MTSMPPPKEIGTNHTPRGLGVEKKQSTKKNILYYLAKKQESWDIHFDDFLG